MRFFIVIPAHNEGRTVGAVIDSLSQLLPDATVIVVDDCSVDNTGAVAVKYGATLVQNNTQQGYAKSVQLGITAALASGAEYVATMDADGEHSARDMATIYQIIENYRPDIIITARDKKNRGIEHLVGTWTRYFFAVSDPFSGLRVFHRSILEQRSIEESYSIGTELVLRSIRSGSTFKEVEIKVNKRTDASRFGNIIWGTLKELRAFFTIIRLTFSR